MSDFSDRCRFYLNESGSNVYQISKQSGLDRTTIQRMLSGQRLPSQKFIETFSDYLHISTYEKLELIELYQIEKIGKSVYLNRKNIQSLLDFLKATENRTLDISNTAYDPIRLSVSKSRHYTADVNSLLEKILTFAFTSQLKNEAIYTNIPAEYDYFFSLLCSCQKKYACTIPVTQLFGINTHSKDTTRPNENLEILCNVFSFLVSPYKDYKPFYYYNKVSVKEYALQIFPYYVITSNAVLLISFDLKTGCITKETSMVLSYQKEFKKIFSLSSPFIKRVSDPIEALDEYCKSFMEYGRPSFTLESQPCLFSMFYSDQLLDRLCPQEVPNRSELLETFLKISSTSFSSLNDYTGFFTLSGVRSFMNTGIITSPIAVYAEAFSPSERKKMLTYLLSNKMSPSKASTVLLNDNFIFSQQVNIELFGRNHLHFITSTPDSFDFLTIDELSICESFSDYFNFLKESDYAYSEEEKCSVIQGFLKGDAYEPKIK